MSATKDAWRESLSLRWRVETMKKPKGEYRILSRGSGKERISLSLGYVSAEDAEAYLRASEAARVMLKHAEGLNTRQDDVEIGRIMQRLIHLHDGPLQPPPPYITVLPADSVIESIRTSTDPTLTREKLLKMLWEAGQALREAPAAPPVSAWLQRPVHILSLREYVEQVWRPVRQKERPDTWRREEGLWRLYLLPTLGDTLIGELNKVVFDEFITTLQLKTEGDASWNTRRLVRAAYRACLTYAERKGHIPEIHKFYDLKGSTEPTRDPPRPLKDEEILAVIEAAGSPMHRALFAFAFEQGPRPGEIARLDWAHVSFETTPNCPWGTVEIPGTKTQRSRRVVGLFPLAHRYLSLYWEEQKKPESGPVFTWHGRPYNPRGSSFRTALKNAAHRAGIDDGRRIFPYLARHTMVSAASRAGVSREDIAAVAGHTNPRMIETVYDHSQVAERVDARRFPNRVKEEKPS